MFEQLKLNIYSNKLVGFAYDFDNDKKSGRYILQLYMVIDDDGLYKFIKYKTFKNYTFEKLYSFADEYGAKPINHYIGQEVGKRLVKKL